jgi:hypothetical protein
VLHFSLETAQVLFENDGLLLSTRIDRHLDLPLVASLYIVDALLPHDQLAAYGPINRFA